MFFEIDENDELVWEYHNPVASNIHLEQGASSTAGSHVFRAYRYGSDFPGLQGQDLSPGNYLELNPDSSHCPVATSATETESAGHGISVFPNPVNERLVLTSVSTEIHKVLLFDIRGKQLEVPQHSVSGTTTEMDLSQLPAGIYLLQLTTDNGVVVERVIKQ